MMEFAGISAVLLIIGIAVMVLLPDEHEDDTQENYRRYFRGHLK